MKRSILLVAILMSCLFVSSAFASLTRVTTMGNVNLYVKDYYNKAIFPATVVHYPNLAILESQTSLGADVGGVLLDVGNPGVFGFFVERAAYVIDYAPRNAEQKFDLYWARPFNDMALGGNIYWWGSSDKVEGLSQGNYEQSVGVIGIRAGLEKQMSNGQIDATVFFEKTSFTNEADGQTVTEPEGYQTFGVVGRWFNQYTKEVAIVPFAGFTSIGEGVNVPNSHKTEDKYTGFMVGSAFNLTPNENVLVVLHVGVSMGKDKTETTPETGDKSEEETSTTTLPFYGVGFEAEITSWLTGRFGANKEVTSEKVDPYMVDGKRTQGAACGETYIGAGMSFGSWIFDVQVAEGFLNAGPNFLSGYTGGLFPMLSVTKKFK